jgi:hypothetical protein
MQAADYLDDDYLLQLLCEDYMRKIECISSPTDRQLAQWTKVRTLSCASQLTANLRPRLEQEQCLLQQASPLPSRRPPACRSSARCPNR